MNNQDIFRMAENPNLISGIYNYCDRWCERCSMTNHCLLYAMEEEERDDPDRFDINNREFWEKLQSIFQQTLEMIGDLAHEQNFCLDSVDIESEMEKEKYMRQEAENNELAQAALRYSNMVENWFKTEKYLFTQKDDELNEKLDLGVDESEINIETEKIQDAVKVIRWYQPQIYVKVMRGLLKDDFDEKEDLHDFPKDSDGSVKVALIGMDRSIGAWGQLQILFPEKTDDILTILLHLDRLRRKTEKEFPEARSFVRPGFDASR